MVCGSPSTRKSGKIGVIPELAATHPGLHGSMEELGYESLKNATFCAAASAFPMSPSGIPKSRLQKGVTLPRWMAVILALFVCLIVIPLVHGVLPWALSTRMARYGWAKGSPGIWNRFGLIVVALAAALLIWILAVVIPQTPQKVKLGLTPSYLVIRGPYRLTRNPMYVAELGLWLGLTIFFGSPSVLIGCLVLWSVVKFIILPREERSLEAAFGQTYLQYKSRVPRWF